MALGHESIHELTTFGSNRHIRGEIRDHLNDGWDMLAVMHPPCTRLCKSGVRWLHVPPPGRTAAEMQAELEAGAALFSDCWRAPIPRIAIENPVMHRHARALLPADLPKPQIVQPWWFGEPFFKATGFYLRGLAPLTASNRLTPPRKALEPARHKAWSAIHRAPPGPDRWKFRSRSFTGIAEACANQWGGCAQEQEARHG
ncbi:hypothetical protein [Phaeovulum sp. W22_SRMD_FR3]|uniref:hypothetical protein n=1 Tax=Phaeovulum sp. W22_SRMD_FR3 TaxID=3240274 RepID=UPI003F9E38CA